MRLSLLLAILLVTAAVSSAQYTTDAQADGAISGTVTDSATGQPVSGAQVVVRPLMPGRTIGQVTSLTTGADGEFRLDHLSAGRYALRAIRTGYVDQGRRGTGAAKAVTVTAGQRLEGVVLSLTPGGSIFGHVSDETGKLLSGASLALMKFSYADGKRQLSDVTAASSDAAGEFRMVGLAPGKYYLRAVAPPPRRTNTASDKAYVPLYYPHATDVADAAALEIRPGEELGGIDFTFATLHTFRLTGQVVDEHTSLPVKNPQITVLSDQGNTTFPPGEFSAGANGNFDLRGIPSGSYILAAQSASRKDPDSVLWGRASVEVTDTDVAGIKLAIGPGADVHGRVRLEGKFNLDLHKLSATLQPRDGQALVSLMPDVDNAPVASDGTFAFHNVPEGSYDIDFSPLPGSVYLKTAGAGEAPEPVTVRGRSASLPELALSPASATVTGTVRRNDQPVAGALVILVPEAKRNPSRRYRTVISNSLGKFTARVAPGDYKVFAWEQAERDVVTDPEAIREYENQGQGVHVEDGGQAEVQVELIPAAEIQ